MELPASLKKQYIGFLKSLANRGDKIARILVDMQNGVFGAPTITPAAEDGTDNIDITIQVKDINGNDLAKKVELLIWLSDTDVDAIGTALTAFAVQGTGTLLQTVTANLMLRVLTDANGRAVVRGTITGGETRFVNVLVAGDTHARSAQIDWAA